MFKFNGDLYRHINRVPRQYAKEIIAEFAHRFKFRTDGQDSLLDIGSGNGDIFGDYILPAMSNRFSRLVVSDITQNMLKVAEQSIQHPKVSYKILDIGRPLDKTVWSEPFDHITSFFSLQYSTNQQQTFLNIHDLLADGGDCLHVILDKHVAFDALYNMSQSAKWAPFLKDVESLIPDYQYVFDPVQDVKNRMLEIGFKDLTVEARDGHTLYTGIDEFKCKFFSHF